MPFNLLKKYNELLELSGMNETQRSASLKRIFDRDITNNISFLFRGKPIYPTPKENGELAMANLFNHLTRKMENQENRHREYDPKRSERLHWIKFHVDEEKSEDMYYFSVNEPNGIRTYIYDETEKYVIVLEPLRNQTAYYLLTAYPLTGKDSQRDKIKQKYKRRRLPNLL